MLISQTFKIKNVLVQGTQSLKEQTIKEIVEDEAGQKRWGIFREENIFIFNASGLRERLNDPLIANLVIKKRLPGTLIILITEKTRVALWQNQNHFYELDDNGIIIAETFKQAQSADSHNLLLTDSSRLTKSEIGERVVEPALLMKIKEISERSAETVKVSFIQYDISEASQGKIIALSEERWAVYFSTVADLSVELNKLAVFISEKDLTDKNWRQAIKYIDLRFGNTRIYYK